MKNKRDSWQMFSKRLVWLREQHGLSRREMAKRLHIGISTLERIEGGELPPRLNADIVFYIQKEFGLSPHRQFEECDW